MSATAEAHAAAPRLERPRHGRAIAGVCAGLGRHLNIDPVLVRIGFVILTALGGAGFLAYVAAVLLIPQEGERYPVAHALTGRRAGMAVGIVLLVVGAAATSGALIGDGLGHVVGWSVVLLGLGGYLVLRPFDRVPRDGDTAFVTAETTVVEPEPRGHATRVVAGAMLLLAGVSTVIGAAGAGLDAQEVTGIAIILAGAAVAAGAFFGASAWLALPPLLIAAVVAALAAAGVVLRGPIGEHSWTPATASDLPKTYQVAIGRGRVDLRQLQIAPVGATHVTLRVGIGDAVVRIPRSVSVEIHAHAGAGRVVTPAGKSNGTDVDRTDHVGPAGAPVLDLDARVGLGQVKVTR